MHVFSDAAAETLGAWSEAAGVFDECAMKDITRKYGATDANAAVDGIKTLIADGQLFIPDAAEPEAGSLKDTYVFKSLCLHLSHDCNMKCAYCFASEGSFGGARALMDFKTARAAINFVISASGGRNNIEIDFFGGEPLLNFGVLKKTVEYAKTAGRNAGKNFRFTLTTNGLLLDEGVRGYVNENMDNLVLSVDGRKEVNDAMRKRPDGSGTYERIVEKFLAVTEKREASWYIRGTYTSKNKDFSKDVLHLADLGFDRLSVEPVVSPLNPELGFAPGDGAELAAEYEKLAYAMFEREKRGKPFEFFHFNVDLEEGPCIARRIKGCGAGYEYAAVTPNGDIYPCHQFAGIEEFRLGSVFNGIDNAETVQMMVNNSLFTKMECRACWAKYLCGGGCAANAWFYNRDINKPNAFYCDLFRKRIECALWLKCAHVT